jgi:hypothetical protein
MPVLLPPTVKRLRQQDCEFEASLGYRAIEVSLSCIWRIV